MIIQVTDLPWLDRSHEVLPIEYVLDMIGEQLVQLLGLLMFLRCLEYEVQVAWDSFLQEDIYHLIQNISVEECINLRKAPANY